MLCKLFRQKSIPILSHKQYESRKQNKAYTVFAYTMGMPKIYGGIFACANVRTDIHADKEIFALLSPCFCTHTNQTKPDQTIPFACLICNIVLFDPCLWCSFSSLPFHFVLFCFPFFFLSVFAVERWTVSILSYKSPLIGYGMMTTPTTSMTMTTKTPTINFVHVKHSFSYCNAKMCAMDKREKKE